MNIKEELVDLKNSTVNTFKTSLNSIKNNVVNDTKGKIANVGIIAANYSAIKFGNFLVKLIKLQGKDPDSDVSSKLVKDIRTLFGEEYRSGDRFKRSKIIFNKNDIQKGSSILQEFPKLQPTLVPTHTFNPTKYAEASEKIKSIADKFSSTLDLYKPIDSSELELPLTSAEDKVKYAEEYAKITIDEEHPSYCSSEECICEKSELTQLELPLTKEEDAVKYPQDNVIVCYGDDGNPQGFIKYGDYGDGYHDANYTKTISDDGLKDALEIIEKYAHLLDKK